MNTYELKMKYQYLVLSKSKSIRDTMINSTAQRSKLWGEQNVRFHTHEMCPCIYMLVYVSRVRHIRGCPVAVSSIYVHT
jgi:hypothetical protein